MLALCEQVPEEALAHSFVTCSSVMATSYNAKVSAMARRNVRKDAYRVVQKRPVFEISFL